MLTDDELLDLLRSSLEVPTDGPSPERVAALRAAASAQPAASSTRPPRPRSRLWLAPAGAMATAAALLVAFLIGRGLERNNPEPTPTRGVVEFDGSLATPGRGPARATAEIRKVGIGRVVRFDTRDLPILPKGDFYELWFVSPADSAATPKRISAGTFHPDPEGRSKVEFTAAVDPGLFPVLSVTAEPGDGNPDATGPEVLRATIHP